MKTKLRCRMFGFLLAVVMVVGGSVSAFAAVPATGEYRCVYTHDPRINAKAMEDIVVNPKAIYGFSPDPNSTRLGEYADYDWSDPAVVEAAKQERIAYHESFRKQFVLWESMRVQGKSTEEIARAVSAMRNESRFASNKDDPVELQKMRKSNLDTYGNENGPTPEFLYEKYGSWDKVIVKSFSSNSGMDACLGLYDAQYENNKLCESILENSTIVYTVRPGDYLIKIAKKYYGNEDSWKIIYAANADKIGEGYVIFPGEQLLIP